MWRINIAATYETNEQSKTELQRPTLNDFLSGINYKYWELARKTKI